MIRHRGCMCGFLICALLVGAGQVRGQTAGNQGAEKKKWGPFEASGSFGIGALFADINGSRSRYRTDLNYLPGVTLNDFRFELKSDGQPGLLMDHLSLTGYGFGDAYPYQRASLTFGKRGRYEFRGDYWKQEYFFSIPQFALGSHEADSARRATDLNLRVFLTPQLTAEFGYYRNYNYGTAFSTANDFQRLFELYDPRRALTQDFRAGLTWTRGPLSISATEGVRLFKDDPSASSTTSLVSDQTAPALQTTVPVRMNVVSTLISGRFAPTDRFELEGKYVYSGGHVDAARSDLVVLQLAQGLSLTEIIKSNSVSDHPEHEFDLSGTVELNDRVNLSTVVDGTRFDITGALDQTLSFRSSTPGSPGLSSSTTDQSYQQYSLFRVRPEIEIRIFPQWSVHVGFQYSDRGVRQDRGAAKDITRTDTGLVGLIWRPYRESRVTLDYENGGADNTFTGIEPRKFQRWRFNAQMPLRNIWLAPHFAFSQRRNHDKPAWYDSDYYQAGIEARYTLPGKRVAVSGGYTLLKLNTLAAIRYFLGSSQTNGVSAYDSRLQLVHARVDMPLGRRVAAWLGYRYLGDPATSSYPLRRHLGEAGLSVRTYKNWTWDLHWQNVSYHEEIPNAQNYMTNLLGVTLRWSY